LLDELGAQYALGTLRGAARARFERLCKQLPAAQNAVHHWEDRLQGMAMRIKPVQPPAAVWQNVQARLGMGREQRAGATGWWQRLQLGLAAGMAAAAVGIVTWLVLNIQSTAPLATFADQQQATQWSIEATEDKSELIIQRVAATPLEANRDYELWALPDSGSAPVSLGLLPKSGKGELRLSAAQRQALAGASKVAISLEPVGGSPTGAPTGPVLFATEVIRVT
jgi:anti-sigma-K factor RskA